MTRSKYFLLIAAFVDNFKNVFLVFRSQRLSLALALVVCVLLLSLFFTFLAFTPVLSPFIYPMF